MSPSSPLVDLRPFGALLAAVAAACSSGSADAPPPGSSGAPGTPQGPSTAPVALGGDSGPEPKVTLPTLPARRTHTFRFATGATSPLGSGQQPPAEGDPSPGNPWLDWRMDLTLQDPGGGLWIVPGFFAGDGEGAPRGDVWSVRFTPPAAGVGLWEGTATLRQGPAVNVDGPTDARGTTVFARPVRFRVEPPPAAAGEGLFDRGPIRPDGDGRLRDANGRLFVKAGFGGPENLLGYAGFEGAQDGLDGGPPGETGGAPDFLHRFKAHLEHWREGDPDWARAGRPRAGRGLIGALNRAAELGANALYVVPMNLGGDGRDTFPFVTNSGGGQSPLDPDHVLHYSVARLAQWSVALEHAQRRGLYVQLVLAEREPTNIAWLGPALGTRRRLFLKQMVAHFGALPGIEWTLCEENAAPGASTFAQFTVAELEAQAHWIRAWDVAQHPRSVHVDPNDLGLFEAMIAEGRSGWLECASLQVNGDGPGEHHLYGELLEECAALFESGAGRRVVVHLDEPGDFRHGAASEDHPAAWAHVPYAGPEARRRGVLYDALLSGAGVMWYPGTWELVDGGGDLTVEDLDTRGQLMGWTRVAREVFEGVFGDTTGLRARDGLWTTDAGAALPAAAEHGDPEVMVATGECALVYFPGLAAGVDVPGELGALDASSPPGSRPGARLARWIDPLTGLQVGLAMPFDPTLPLRPSPVPLVGVPEQDWLLAVR